MKKMFAIIVIFLMLFTQFSQSIAVAAGNAKLKEHVTISLEEGGTTEKAIFKVLISEEVDELNIKYPENAKVVEDFITNDQAIITNNKESHSLNINSLDNIKEINFALKDLKEGENLVELEGLREQESIATKDFTFHIKSSDIQQNNEPSSDVEKIENTVQKDDESNTSKTSKNNEQSIITPFSGNLNVDIDISPRNTNVLSGNDAAFKLVFKTTGAIAEYTNAIIYVDLPISETVTFNQNLSELSIAGVQPVLDTENNRLVYEYETLKTGQTYENIIKLNTSNGITPDGMELKASTSFEAKEQEKVVDDATVAVNASNPINVSKKFTSVQGNDRNLPTPNSQTVWKINVDIPKDNIGQLYLEENSKIKVVDTLPDGLSYNSVISGPEPEQNGNQLVWTFDVPSFDEQEMAEDTLFNANMEVVLTVGPNTVDQSLQNTVGVSALFIDNFENNVNAQDSIKIVDSDSANGDIEGTWYVPTHVGPLDDEGTIGPGNNKDPNPTVYDDALLGFSHGIAPLPESAFGNFREYATRYNIDPNLIFVEIETPKGFIYRPNVNYPSGVPLKNDPIFNIEAVVNGKRVLLVENAAYGTMYNRVDLGINENDKVSSVILDFTYAPSGMLNVGRPNYFFEVEPGYTGPVTNHWDVYGVDGEGNSFVNQYNTDPLAGPRSAQIVPKPTDQPPIGTVGVELEDHQGAYVVPGDNRMRIDLNTESSSTLAMGQLLETVVLLPSGVIIASNPQVEFIDADGRSSIATSSAAGGGYEVLSNNYNDSGRQLVKFNWNDRLLRPGKTLYAEINVQVDGNAPNTLSFDVYGFSGDEKLTVPNVEAPGLTDTVLQTDMGDLNENSNPDQPRLKSGNEYYISGQYNIQTEKLVKGQLDDKFTHFGSTIPGGTIDYQLKLTNTSGKDISSMTMIDVMPSVNDLGITDNINRGSQFTPKLTGAIQLPSAWMDKVNVYYSTAMTPERDDLIQNTDYPDTTEKLSNPATAEKPNWILGVNVDDWSTIHSFKIELKAGVEWVEGEDITINFRMDAPKANEVDLGLLDKNVNPTERAAWNSFAIATDKGQPVEPARVGVYMNLDNSVQLTKRGETGETLEGAVFTLRNEAGEELETGLTTNENGIIVVEDLLPGNYEFIETKAPTGYQLDETPIPFEIQFAQQAKIEVSKENEYATGSVELTKHGEDGKTLEGVTFELQDTEGTMLQANLVTNDTGKLVISDLKPGNYQLVETATIPGYELDPTPIKFEIVVGQTEVAKVSFENPLSMGAVELTKVGEEGNTLEGAVFKLVNGEGEELQTGLTTNEAGVLVVKDLKPGNYAFIETEAPFGYQLDETPIEFEIVFNQQETLKMEVENGYIPSTLELTKKGEDGKLLEGVVFELQDSEGTTLEEGLVTDGNGKLTITDLKPGSYQLVETATIPGYELDSTPILFDIGLGQTEVAEVSFENPFSSGSVELTKVGEEGNPLEGAVFKLVNGEGEELQTGLTTDEAGVLVVKDLKPGNYAFIETEAPFGYQLDETPIEFEIVFNQQEVLEIEMTNVLITGSVELTKHGEDGKTLEGVTFELQDAEGTMLQANLVTNDTGTLVISDLKPGNYQLVETATIPGYDLDPTPIKFEIVVGQTEVAKVSFENPLSKGSVELTKVGEEGNTLEGAVFKLVNDKGEELQTGLTTNEAGVLVVKDLKPGSYAFIETEAPFGYQLDETPIEFEVVFNQQETLKMEVENGYIPSTLELTKKGEDGKLLEGVVFELQDSEGNTLEESLVTDGNGKLTIADLKPGSYQLVETATIPGYELDSTPILFDIGLGQTEVAEVSFENPLSSGSVELTKVGEAGNALEGAVFKLVNGEGEELQTGLTTNEAGVLVVKDLKPGNYAFIETEAPFGYQLDETPIEFEIVFNQQEVLEIEMTNVLITGSVELTKHGEDGKALEGVTFELQDTEGTMLQANLVTNDTGKLVISDLKPGNYQLVETATIPGYELDPTPIKFEIVVGQTEVAKVSFENPLSMGAVELTKVGEEGNTLEGAAFKLVNEKGEELQTGLTTNEAGVLVVKDLKPGNYAFIETEAPFGYQLDETPIEFEIVFNQQETLKMEVENGYIPSTLELTKKGEDGKLLEGVVFKLQDSEGTTLEEGLVTDGNGKLTITDLKPGSYQLVETATIPGYELDSTPILFDIGLGQTEVAEVSFENPLSSGSVELTKVGEAGNPLEGAVFKLVNEKGEELQTGLTTNEAGVLVVKNLKPGNYAFIETEAPFGYQLDETPIEFEILFNQQETLSLEFKNTLLETSLQIMKVDAITDATLEGAVFDVLNSEGELITTVKSDESGIVVVDGLRPGTYQIVETKAPNGYVQLENPINIKIELGDKLKEVIVENTPEELPVEPPVEPTTPDNNFGDKLPQTGEEWLRYLAVIGMILVGTGSFLLYTHIRRMRYTEF